jgi:hypothetical protein
MENAMKSLPTALTTKQLDALLDSFPSNAEIERGEDVVTVHGTRRRDGQRVKVLSAVSHDRQHWHVMAVPGLINPTIG